jgi:hypothetical protein
MCVASNVSAGRSHFGRDEVHRQVHTTVAGQLQSCIPTCSVHRKADTPAGRLLFATTKCVDGPASWWQSGPAHAVTTYVCCAHIQQQVVCGNMLQDMHMPSVRALPCGADHLQCIFKMPATSLLMPHAPACMTCVHAFGLLGCNNLRHWQWLLIPVAAACAGADNAAPIARALPQPAPATDV